MESRHHKHSRNRRQMERKIFPLYDVVCMVWAHKMVWAGRMACEMAHRMACEIAHGMVGKMACQWACKKAFQWACKRAFQWACRMVWVGHKMVWVACILKNNPVLAHMMLDNRQGLVVADILHSGNPVVDRMVDSIQGAAAGSYIPGVGNTQGAAADSYIAGVGNAQGAVGNSYIAGVGNTQGAVGNSYIAGVDTQAGNLLVQHMGSSFAGQRLEQHTTL